MASTSSRPAQAQSLPRDFNYSLLAGAESLGPASAPSSTSSSASSASASSDDEAEPSSRRRRRTDDAAADDSSATEDEVHDRQIKDDAKQELKPWGGPNKVLSQDPNDWLWMHTEEPHRSRRRAILKAHPEVTKLMGYEPLTRYVVLLVVTIQLATCWLLRDTSPLNWKFLLAAYVIGGTANQNLFLAIHEITHNLAFRGIWANRWFAIFANLPIGIPYAMMFKKYHMEHHRALGVDGVDTDLPTRAELLVLKNVAGKAFFCTFQIFFYALRPGFVRSQRLTRWHAFNFLTQLCFDALLVGLTAHLSPASWKWAPLVYLILSSFFAGSLHPCAGHFIAEHYLFDGWDQETWSYYGPLNALTYNVGYHNEHHDFPSVPWTRLPALRALAPEFYDHLPRHDSWVMVTWNFIFRTDVGLFSRVKRLPPKQTAEKPDVLEDASGAGGKGRYGGLKDD